MTDNRPDHPKQGSTSELDELWPVIYDELRQVADSFLRKERCDHTLQPTALVHEAYLRLLASKDISFDNPAAFRALTAKIMRNILIDHARGKNTAKRGGGARPITLDVSMIGESTQVSELLELDEALLQLADISPRRARLVELRYFGGLSTQEAAETLGIAVRTAQCEWRSAKAWLCRQLGVG